MRRLAGPAGAILVGWLGVWVDATAAPARTRASEVRNLTDVVRERSRHRIVLPLGPASLERAWLARDLARLGSSALKADNPALYDALLRRRNLAWADRLAAEMAGSGTELVNAGALHMTNDDGLPALMAARGFNVERVQ